MSLPKNEDLQATMETPLELADQHHVSIEIPSSPSDMAVSIEAGSDPLPLAQAQLWAISRCDESSTIRRRRGFIATILKRSTR